MTDFTNIYVDEPDIPAGMTIAEYRRARPRQTRSRRSPWWQRLLRTS